MSIENARKSQGGPDKETRATTIELETWVLETFDAYVAQAGMHKKALISKLITWFMEQDRTLQAIILRQVDPIDEIEIIEVIGRRMRNAGGGEQAKKRAARK